MRLIDADKVKIELSSTEKCPSCEVNGTEFCKNDCYVNLMCNLLDKLPTVGTPQGKWITHPDNKNWDICTHCNIGTRRRHYGINPDGSEYVTEYCYVFCPNCGADMRKGADNGKK